MSCSVGAGSILIADGTHMPPGVQIDSEAYSPGWTAVAAGDCRSLEERISKAGWSLFYLAGSMKRTVLGFRKDQMTTEAVSRLLGDVTSGHFNCIQIDAVSIGHFLVWSCITVSAHARHIQESRTMVRENPISTALPYRLYV